MRDEERWIQQLRAGDPEGLRRIYEQYKDHLFTVAVYLLVDAAAAEDCLHDVFVAFARGARGLHRLDNLKGFLATCVAISGKSSLDTPPTRQYSMVLTNPPFGKKQSLKTVNEEGDLDSEDEVVVRQDFWASTGNKQLNFVQHIFNLLKVGGRAAVVVPDNVLFEGGPGQKIRQQLLQQCDVHTVWFS